MTTQEAQDAKQDRDDALYWKLHREIEAAHPDWSGADILAEIQRRVAEMVN